MFRFKVFEISFGKALNPFFFQFYWQYDSLLQRTTSYPSGTTKREHYKVPPVSWKCTTVVGLCHCVHNQIQTHTHLPSRWGIIRRKHCHPLQAGTLDLRQTENIQKFPMICTYRILWNRHTIGTYGTCTLVPTHLFSEGPGVVHTWRQATTTTFLDRIILFQRTIKTTSNSTETGCCSPTEIKPTMSFGQELLSPFRFKDRCHKAGTTNTSFRPWTYKQE
jgi:hypothetical protein